MINNKKTDLLPPIEKATIIVRLLFIILVFNLISCGKTNISWPAKIESFTGFNKIDQRDIVISINDLNSRSKNPFFLFDSAPEGNQKIYFKMADKDLPAENGSMIAAQALTEIDKCTIEVFPAAFEDNILKTVIWHELGHCAGLEHSKNNKDIMYYMVYPMSIYNENSIDTFLLGISKSLK